MNKREIEQLAAELRGKRWTRTDAQRVMRAWRGSGEGPCSFARRMGIHVQRLYWWKDRLGEGDEQSAAAGGALEQALAPLLLPVTVRDAGWSSRAEAVLVAEVGPVRVAVQDVQAVPAPWLGALLRALREGLS